MALRGRDANRLGVVSFLVMEKVLFKYSSLAMEDAVTIGIAITCLSKKGFPLSTSTDIGFRVRLSRGEHPLLAEG